MVSLQYMITVAIVIIVVLKTHKINPLNSIITGGFIQMVL